MRGNGDDPGRQHRRHLVTRPLLALAAAQVSASTAAGLSLTVATVTALKLSGSEQIAGLAQTAMVVGASALTVPIARLSARFGRRVSLFTGYVVAAAGALCAYASVGMGSWPLLLVGLLFVGGGTVASLAARFAAADAGRVPADAAVAIGFVLWAATVGSIVGPNLVGLLGSLDGAGAFLVLAALYGLAAVIVAVWVPASLGERSPRASGRTSLRNVAGILRAHPLAVRGLGISALSHATMIALMAMAPVHLHHDSAPASVVGLVMSAHLASMYIMSPAFGRLVKRFGALRMGAAGLAVTALAAGILAVGAVGNDLVFGAGLALLGFGWSIGMVAGSTLVTQGLDPASRHASQGTTDLALNVGGGAASVIAGTIVAAAGYTALAVLVCAIATVSVLVLRPGRRPQAETLPPFSS